VALQMGRRGVGSELKPSYFAQAVRNLINAEREHETPTLLDLIEQASLIEAETCQS
jgi:hypothetical protein